MTWQIVLKFGWVLIFLAAAGNAQNPNGEESTPGLKPDLKGESVFGLKCATCHGLDGQGGEHAPDIVGRSEVKALSDRALVRLIHDGIPEGGMPGFSSMGKDDVQTVVAYLRQLQGKSADDSAAGDPVRGRDIFFGKAGCSACHEVSSRGQFVAGDLTAFAQAHAVGEIRDAILSPDGEQQESVTAVTRDGRKFSGMIRNEDNASLQLQGGDGRFYLLMKSSLVSIQRKAGDPMPVDYGQRLSAAEVDDLVAYILREGGAAGFPALSTGKDEEPHARD